MKKCYTLILLCLFGTVSAFSQDRYWVGPTGSPAGLWSNSANWSATSGGAGGASVPNGAGFNVIFNQNALVNLDVSGLLLNLIRVTNSSRATIFTGVNNTINVNSSAIGNEALVIDAGSALVDSTSTGTDFQFMFNTNARAEINGNWELGSNMAFTGSAYFLAFDNNVVNFNSGSRLIFRGRGGGDGLVATLFFKNGSLLHFDQNGGATPVGTYEANSTIRITGNTTQVTNIAGSPPDVGNIEFDCAGLTSSPVSLGLVNANIKGYFKILNTNNRILNLLNNVGGTPTTTITGNLEISGTSSVALANNNLVNNLQVNGNFVQSGGTFSLQNSNGAANTSRLMVRGSFTQTGGTFTATSAATSNATNLFVLELNGTTPQTISSSSGSIDNGNNQVALRLNNSNHITLSSPLATGRVHFVTGNLNTNNTNYLTINNTGNNAIDISGVSSSSYVAGPVRRKTAATTAYTFPVGKAGAYHLCEVVPSTVAASEYQAEYFNTAYSDLSAITPLSGVANDRYWEISRISGSAAVVRLTLNGAVPGASPTDALVVARYNGADWVNEKGTTGTKITPGNATSGTAASQSLASFSPFTFGYGPAALLPIKLQYFTAQKGNGFNTLNWKADCYSTQAVFQIERSFDGRQFTKIETIVADQLRCLQPFDFRDNTAGTGNVYYRINVVDVDGTAYYSRIVAIVGKSSGFEIVGIYPSVVTNSQLKVNIAAGHSSNAEFYITGTSGQIIKRFKFTLTSGDNIITVNIPELAAGVYQVTGFNSDGQMRTFRFVKQ